MKQRLSISKARRELTRLPDQFEKEPGVITVTRFGKPVMVILPFEMYKTMQEIIEKLQETVEGYQETIEIMKDEELMASFRRGVQDLKEGKCESWDVVSKRLGWK